VNGPRVGPRVKGPPVSAAPDGIEKGRPTAYLAVVSTFYKSHSALTRAQRQLIFRDSQKNSSLFIHFDRRQGATERSNP